MYRNQWATIATPYKTYGISFDMRTLEGRQGNFSLGTGLGVYRDVAGDNDLGITNAVLSLSGIIKLDQKQYLTVGAQGGFEQRSIDANKQEWDSQYDGSGHNPVYSSEEEVSYNQGFGAGDINAGIAWMYSESKTTLRSNDNFSVRAGIVYQHIMGQELKYGAGLEKENLYRKLSFHGASNLAVKNSNYSFKPSFIYQRQGPNQEILLGTLVRYTLGFDSKYTGLLQKSAVSIGIHTRVGDAVIPSIGYELSHWKILFSYDSNFSKLRSASNRVGGFELTLTFLNPSPFASGKGHVARFN